MIQRVDDLGGSARRALRWTALSAFCGVGLQLLQILVLARLLEPGDFGRMAMIIAMISIASTFAELGLSSAIIQKPSVLPSELSTLYVVNLLVGLAFFLVAWIVAPWITAVVGFGDITGMVRVAAAVFVVAPLGLQFRALLQKTLNFRLLTLVVISGQAVGTSVAISLALNDVGVWSLIIGYVGTEATTAVLLVLVGTQLGFWSGFGWDLRAVRSYLVFGGFRLAAMIANGIHSRMDQLAIGSLIGPTSLGYYTVAQRLVWDPVQRINPIVTRVAFPAFALVQDDPERLRSGYLRMNELLLGINAPLLLGFAAAAPLAVPLLLGPGWDKTIFLVQVLVFYALFRSVGNAGGALVMAKGRADWSFYWNLLLLVLMPTGILIAVLTTDGIGGIAGILTIMQGLLLILHYFILVRRLIGPCGYAYFRSVARPLLIAMLMALSVWQIDTMLVAYAHGPRLAIMMAAGSVIYLLLSMLFQQKLVRELLRLVGITRLY